MQMLFFLQQQTENYIFLAIEVFFFYWTKRKPFKIAQKYLK